MFNCVTICMLLLKKHWRWQSLVSQGQNTRDPIVHLYYWKFKWIVECVQLENVHGLNCIREYTIEVDNKILSYILIRCTDSGMGKDGTLMQDPSCNSHARLLALGLFSLANYFISTHKSIYFLRLDKNNNKEKYWYFLHYLTKEESEGSQISWNLYNITMFIGY